MPVTDDQDITPYTLDDEEQTPAQQMASLVSPADAASLVKPPDVVSTATPAAYSSGRAALQAIGAPPQLDQSRMQQLQQRRNTDATPINPYSDQYKPGVGLKIRRGLAAALSGGIPAALNTNYSAPNRQFRVDDAARQARLGQDTAQIGDLEKNFDESVKGYQRGVDYAGKVNAADKNDNTQTKNDAQLQAFNAQHGLKVVTDPATGQTTTVDDPDSEAFKDKQALTNVRQAAETLKQAQADVEKSKNDPNSPAFKLAQQKLAAAISGHQAAMLGAQARWGNYQMHANGVGLDGQPLQGATVLGDKPVGTALQGTVQKQQPKVAQFNDVHGALDSLENSAKALTKSGGKLNSPAVAAAMADPKSTSAQYLQGLVAKGQLTPQERDYVIARAAAVENIMALRSSVGGGVSDSQVNRLVGMVPNASTPDLDYALRQTGQIRQTATRLGTGLPNVVGGNRVRGSQPANSAPKPIDRATAAGYLKDAGGDVDKARKAAAKDGYKF